VTASALSVITLALALVSCGGYTPNGQTSRGTASDHGDGAVRGDFPHDKCQRDGAAETLGATMRGAFVIRLETRTEPSQGRFEGWLEEVDSGEEQRFVPRKNCSDF